jgi:hypothetical protein
LAGDAREGKFGRFGSEVRCLGHVPMDATRRCRYCVDGARVGRAICL